MSSARGNLSIPGWVTGLNDSQSDSVEDLVVDELEGEVTARTSVHSMHEAEPCIDSIGGSRDTPQLPIHPARDFRDGDFDLAPNHPWKNFGGEKALGTMRHKDSDKNSRLTKEWQSMLTSFSDRILERLDSQFASCQQTMIDSMRDNFQQLSSSSAAHDNSAGVVASAVRPKPDGAVATGKAKEDAWKTMQRSLKLKKAFKGVLAGVEQRKALEMMRPKPQHPMRPHSPNIRAGIAYPEPTHPGTDLIPVLPVDEALPRDGQPATLTCESQIFAQRDDEPIQPARSGQPSAPALLGIGRRTATVGLAGIQKGGIFADSENMKEKLRKEMLLPKYEVSDLYKKEGICQQIARNQCFEYFTLAVISVNAVWMAIDIDYNKADVLTEAHPVFQIGEHLFCLYFTSEWIVRFGAFHVKRNAFTDRWFCLDSFLVAMMVFETWFLTLVYTFMVDSSSGGSGIGNASIFRLVRLIRLTRMARLAKLLRAMPELMTIVKGMFIAARTVFFMLCLLVCTVYVFAIAFRQITEGTDVGSEYFPSVGVSMSSLLLRGNLPDVQDFVDHVSSGSKGGSPFFGVLLMVFICIGYVTLLNMLVGVLVSVVTVTAAVEKEQLAIMYVKDMMERAFHAANIGTDHGDTINVDDFVSFISHPDAYKALASVDCDVVGLLDFSDFIFQGNATLTFHEFVDIILRLRGSNKATVKDIVDLRLSLGSEIKQLKAVLLDHIERQKDPVWRDSGVFAPTC